MQLANILIISILVPLLVGMFSYFIKVYIDNYFFQKNMFCGLMLYDVFLAFLKSDNLQKDWNKNISFNINFIIRKINISHLEYINTIKLDKIKINNSEFHSIEIIYFMDTTNKNILFFIPDYNNGEKLFNSIYTKKEFVYFGKNFVSYKIFYKNYKKLIRRRRKSIIIPGISIF